jgi:uncharacterized protein (TIGR03083 family)
MDTAAIRRAIDELGGAFRRDMAALPAAAWAQPSDCAGWTVAAAFIHVVQVCEMLQDSLARGRAGDAGPPPLAAQEGIPAWRAARAERQKLALTQSPAELLAWYDQAQAAMSVELAAIPGAAPGAQGWHPVGARPLAWVRDQWLFELTLHDWDIRVALDPTADIRPSVQSAFARTLPDRVGRGFTAAGDPAVAGTYRIEVSGALPLTVSIQVGNGSVTVLRDDTGTPTATIRTDPEAFGLVTTNRRPVGPFIAAGRWQATGDTVRADAFARAFASY